ncbi:hypothetical protein SeLEV6574_g03295 [Synchytrium endobioticum]|uniref:Uncharacterized protein n=1 Tax=Synchytrium endobioticum TaxID=286115 RepID=A0A507D4B2_9FUNG|nr:hypothetical protein SeLEV6574_g03295 [Synchytrium endobioticum]
MQLKNRKKRREGYETAEESDEDAKNVYLGPDDWVMKLPQYITSGAEARNSRMAGRVISTLNQTGAWGEF